MWRNKSDYSYKVCNYMIISYVKYRMRVIKKSISDVSWWTNNYLSDYSLVIVVIVRGYFPTRLLEVLLISGVKFIFKS